MNTDHQVERERHSRRSTALFWLSSAAHLSDVTSLGAAVMVTYPYMDNRNILKIFHRHRAVQHASFCSTCHFYPCVSASLVSMPRWSSRRTPRCWIKKPGRRKQEAETKEIGSRDEGSRKSRCEQRRSIFLSTWNRLLYMRFCGDESAAARNNGAIDGALFWFLRDAIFRLRSKLAHFLEFPPFITYTVTLGLFVWRRAIVRVVKGKRNGKKRRARKSKQCSVKRIFVRSFSECLHLFRTASTLVCVCRRDSYHSYCEVKIFHWLSKYSVGLLLMSN